MKTYVLTVLFNLIILSSIHGKIRNGYDPQLALAHKGLENLKTLLITNSSLSIRERTRIQRHIARHEQFIRYHKLTSQLLSQFKIIAGDFFLTMDTINDRKRRQVDVYVKLVPPGGLLLGDFVGTANLTQASDMDAYYSYYGIHTASINVAIGPNAIFNLGHELGHLFYQIPNAFIYRNYFNQVYKDIPSRCVETGHRPGDPSGQSALKHEKLFHVWYGEYRKKM